MEFGKLEKNTTTSLSLSLEMYSTLNTKSWSTNAFRTFRRLNIKSSFDIFITLVSYNLCKINHTTFIIFYLETGSNTKSYRMSMIVVIGPYHSTYFTPSLNPWILICVQEPKDVEWFGIVSLNIFATLKFVGICEHFWENS